METRRSKVKKIEHHLRQYKTYLVSIKNLENQIEWIMPSMTASYSASEGSCGTFNVSSKVEQAVLDRMESKQALDLHEEKERYQLIVQSIKAALEPLDDLERSFVEKRYFERKGIKEVADQLQYSDKYLNTIRNRIMDSLLISLSNVLKL